MRNDQILGIIFIMAIIATFGFNFISSSIQESETNKNIAKGVCEGSSERIYGESLDRGEKTYDALKAKNQAYKDCMEELK
jgi:hypothetical protein